MTAENNINKLNEDDRKVLTRMGKRKTLSFVKAMTKLYNILCYSCKRKVLLNPRQQLESFCSECQPKVKDTLERFQK